MSAPAQDLEPTPPPGKAGHLYLAGDIIAQKYRLTRLLGEGGMGAVWLARNMKLDVDVAIKLIRRELATDEASARLLQEARAAARIGHRSIVRVFDFGETELDDPFIVMEVLSGESLRQVLERKGRLPAANAVSTLLPIASALAEAHAGGIVHRDLKPENILLVPDKSGGVVPKIVDFGIAAFHRGDEGGAGDDEAARGMVFGTPDYMSPEQAGGRDKVDEGADVWALAVILYEAITGRVPFTGPNYNALIFSIMTEAPAPTHEQLAGDAGLWSILEGALAKMSADRPRMRDFGKSLAEWAIAQGIESDIAGTSLAAHWLSTGEQRSPFSVAPPRLDAERMTTPELILPKPAPLPGDVAPPGASVAVPRRRGRVGLAVAGLVAVAILVLVWSGRTTSSAPPPPVAGTATAQPAPPATSATASPPAASASAPEPVAPASAEAQDAPASSAHPVHGRPIRKKPRNSNLSIAKEPNF
jgi:serine/threonine-protein kinase